MKDALLTYVSSDYVTTVMSQFGGGGG